MRVPYDYALDHEYGTMVHKRTGDVIHVVDALKYAGFSASSLVWGYSDRADTSFNIVELELYGIEELEDIE